MPSMHELPVVKALFQIVMDHAQKNEAKRVVQINLRIGLLSDLVDEWIRRYFEMLAENTIARGAGIDITRTPVVMRCRACGCEFEVSRDELGKACPECKEKGVDIVSGREYTLESIAIE